MEPTAPGALPVSPTSLLAQLEAIFPESNAALYDGGIVLLLSRPGRDFQPAPIFDREQLRDLLTRYDAFAAISNATSRRAMLRTNYLLTKSVLQLDGPCAHAKRNASSFLRTTPSTLPSTCASTASVPCWAMTISFISRTPTQ